MTHHDARAEMKRPERGANEQHRAPDTDGQHDGQGAEHQGMAQLAEQITRHYDEPAPQSRPPIPEPFPPAVMHGLSLGAAQGAAVGAVIGYVLANNMLVVPGWELMYSAAPATIITLWLFLGAALGVATVGVGTLLTTSADSPQEQAAGGKRTEEPSAQHERVGERTNGTSDDRPSVS